MFTLSLTQILNELSAYLSRTDALCTSRHDILLTA